MRPTPTAIGYIHRDISGSSQAWDTAQIRKLANRLGYDIAEIVLLDSTAPDIVAALREVIRETDAEAVIMPNLAHLDNQPDALVRVCDVITVNPIETYDRHSLPPIRMQAE